MKKIIFLILTLSTSLVMAQDAVQQDKLELGLFQSGVVAEVLVKTGLLPGRYLPAGQKK